MRPGIAGIGLVAPGLPSWEAAREVLAGRQEYAPAPLERFVPGVLPANERRRTTPPIKLALQVAEEAVGGVTPEAAELASVFASSDGDLVVVDRICSALAQPDRPVSPTDFHNSVHNAPAGYWGIAAGATEPSTSISAREDTFAAGLLEAATQVMASGAPVLLVAYDHPAPGPLAERPPVRAPFGVSLVLTPDTGAARLRLVPGATDEVTPMEEASLEALRRSSPAARSLPLLAGVAAGTAVDVRLRHPGPGRLQVEYRP
ncbi:beta-ketoacyl synthase chain length factor [Thiohalospira sp.]|uniref:beta-ketoacyl synthase chain length factor n=1 Tax=Thiohalospira sp. TaxID=3080549 RepID=UPI00397FD07A